MFPAIKPWPMTDGWWQRISLSSSADIFNRRLVFAYFLCLWGYVQNFWFETLFIGGLFVPTQTRAKLGDVQTWTQSVKLSQEETRQTTASAPLLSSFLCENGNKLCWQKIRLQMLWRNPSDLFSVPLGKFHTVFRHSDSHTRNCDELPESSRCAPFNLYF